MIRATDNFDWNLAQVLAHSAVFFSKEEWLPVADALNTTSTQTFIGTTEGCIIGAWQSTQLTPDKSGVDCYSGSHGAFLRQDGISSGSLIYLPRGGAFYQRMAADGTAILPYFAPLDWEELQTGFIESTPSTGGAIAFDAAASAQVTGAGSITWAHVCTGVDRFLVVWVCSGNNSAVSATVTYAGVSMTQFAAVDDGSWNRIIGFYLINPASGSNNVVVTLGTTPTQAAGGSISFKNVHQTTPLGTATTDSNHLNTTNTINVSSATGEMVVAGTMTDDDDGIAVGGTATQRWQQSAIGNDTCAAGSTDAGAGTVTMSWTQGVAGWASIGVGVKPASGGGQTVSPSSIASSEAMGSPTSNLFVNPTGIATSEALGNPGINQTAGPTGIASSQAMGSPGINQTAAPTGIASTSAMGTPGINQTASPTGIASQEALGSPTATTGSTTVNPTGIASSEALGSPKINQTVNVAGIAGGGTTYFAASASRTDVNAAIALASPGDTVVVPASAGVSWAGNITISGISLIGPGKNAGSPCVVTSGKVNITKHSTHSTKLIGFRFTGTSSSDSEHFEVTGSLTARPYVVGDCYFLNDSNLMGTIRTNGGLWYDCEFATVTPHGADIFISNLGGVDGNTSWAAAHSMGTADTNGDINTYFEDCTWTGFLEASLDVDDGSRCVFRHCTFNDSSLTVHGGGSGGSLNDTSAYGGRHLEIYDCTFDRVDNNYPVNKWVWWRGSSGVFANNTYEDASSTNSNYPNKPELVLTVGCGGGAYPRQYQVGQSTQTPDATPNNPILIFGNTRVGGSSGAFIAIGENPNNLCSTPQDYIIEDRDYSLSNSWSWTPYPYPHWLRSTTGIGSPAVKAVVGPTGIASQEAMGNPTVVVQGGPLLPASIPSSEALGTPRIHQTTSISGIGSSEALGSPIITQNVVVTGIASSGALGLPAIHQTVIVVGLASSEARGNPAVLPKLVPIGIASGEALGSPFVGTPSSGPASPIRSRFGSSLKSPQTGSTLRSKRARSRPST